MSYTFKYFQKRLFLLFTICSVCMGLSYHFNLAEASNNPFIEKLTIRQEQDFNLVLNFNVQKIVKQIKERQEFKLKDIPTSSMQTWKSFFAKKWGAKIEIDPRLPTDKLLSLPLEDISRQETLCFWELIALYEKQLNAKLLWNAEKASWLLTKETPGDMDKEVSKFDLIEGSTKSPIRCFKVVSKVSETNNPKLMRLDIDVDWQLEPRFKPIRSQWKSNDSSLSLSSIEQNVFDEKASYKQAYDRKTKLLHSKHRFLIPSVVYQPSITPKAQLSLKVNILYSRFNSLAYFITSIDAAPRVYSVGDIVITSPIRTYNPKTGIANYILKAKYPAEFLKLDTADLDLIFPDFDIDKGNYPNVDETAEVKNTTKFTSVSVDPQKNEIIWTYDYKEKKTKKPTFAAASFPGHLREITVEQKIEFILPGYQK